MPSRSEVLKKITEAAKAKGLEFAKAREGGNHTIYSLDGLMIPIGRHRQFEKRYAETVYKECEPKLGEGWWR